MDKEKVVQFKSGLVYWEVGEEKSVVSSFIYFFLLKIEFLLYFSFFIPLASIKLLST